ncbi:7488_t:CDS:2 [Funneliformis geosporum]|uniref:7488_t:CDS:1 n=1 Tax=Funneliformis geosporum TaxID=1117311 RepID=A0A9W4WZX4_9GLOM|nr:7488_t:CDS:2 [Funneliformis geosporum]
MSKDIHLVVFVHGLWGNPGHLQYLVDNFEDKHGHDVHILNSKNNSSAYTYDGVDINKEVKSLQDKTFKVAKFSIVGYSLGIRREDDKTFTKLTNWASTTLLSKTGEQLTFVDKYEENEPILLTISRPDKIYFKALSAFKYRALYANVRNDRTVPFWTASISEVDPFDNFEELNITITVQGILSRRRVQKILASKAKNEVYSFNHAEISVRATSLEEDAVETAMNIRNFLTPSSPTTTNPPHSPLLPSNVNSLENFTTTSSAFPPVHVCHDQREVFANLNRLTWKKFAVCLDAFNSHAAIVMRNRLQSKGKDIIKHFVNETFKDN